MHAARRALGRADRARRSSIAWTFLLGRTRFGRYVYAIGGNAEAARRAGINVGGSACIAFTLAGFTAGARA